MSDTDRPSGQGPHGGWPFDRLTGETRQPAEAPGAPAPRAPAPGGPGTGTPAAGTPAAGTPVTGTPVAGTPAAGAPVTGTSAAGTSAAGSPAAGTSAAGTSATGVPVPPATGPTTTTTPARRRPPVWLLVLVGVLVVALAVVAVLVLGARRTAEPSPAPPAETVTLPVPTPTLEPIARTPGTAFYDALPSTVLAYALTASADEPGLVTAGALEGYRLTYSDGGSVTLTTAAGQWATPEAAEAAYQAMVAQQTPLLGPDATVQEGPVQVAGTEVGRFTIVPRADGMGSVTWRNGTVVVQVDGPADALPDVLAAFPL